MKSLRRLLPAALVVVATALAADVSTDYDHKADFGRYRTYSWIGARAGNTLWQDRIMSAVDSQLAGKGWTRVDANGDAGVAAFGHTEQQQTLETFYNGFPGWGWHGWGGGTATTTVIPEKVGTLTVDVFDGPSKRLIWRGRAETSLSDKPEKNVRKLADVVDDMFKKFPPKSKD